MQEFNIFRLNCLLADHSANNYKSVIISLVKEYIIINDNKFVSRTECYNYVSSIVEYDIEKDQFDTILEKSNQFIFDSGTDDVFISLSDDKYEEIKSKTKTQSLEYHIQRFIEQKELPKGYIDKFTKIIYESIYTNISSFSTKNIKSIIKVEDTTKFTKDELDAFNDFMDWNDHKKDISLFNLFLKTIEFAILTSGRGVKEFTKKLFDGKSFLLDANIIFRLIGIGGEERKKSLRSLLRSCKQQGIKFQYSMATYDEVIRKLENSIMEISNYSQKGSIQYLSKVLDAHQYLFNDGFLIHYCNLLNKGVVKSVQKYDLFMRAELKALDSEYEIERLPVIDTLDGIKVNSLTNHLFSKKKQLHLL